MTEEIKQTQSNILKPCPWATHSNIPLTKASHMSKEGIAKEQGLQFH
jgi:hypothetical protein